MTNKWNVKNSNISKVRYIGHVLRIYLVDPKIHGDMEIISRKNKIIRAHKPRDKTKYIIKKERGILHLEGGRVDKNYLVELPKRIKLWIHATTQNMRIWMEYKYRTHTLLKGEERRVDFALSFRSKSRNPRVRQRNIRMIR